MISESTLKRSKVSLRASLGTRQGDFYRSSVRIPLGQSVDIVLNSKDCHGTKRLADCMFKNKKDILAAKLKLVNL